MIMVIFLFCVCNLLLCYFVFWHPSNLQDYKFHLKKSRWHKLAHKLQSSVNDQRGALMLAMCETELQ